MRRLRAGRPLFVAGGFLRRSFTSSRLNPAQECAGYALAALLVSGGFLRRSFTSGRLNPAQECAGYALAALSS